MTEEEFLARWNIERDIYKAWGIHVVSRIEESVGRLAPHAPDLFIRIPPKPRLKTDASILEKAFRRQKSYADPYAEITDKVGTRFVVLLGRDIKIMCDLIEDCSDWECSRDRDYQREQENNPIQFEYAAVHYVVRCRNEFESDDYVIPAGMPCEVQVKTLLQHAYSELTHDTIYKPSVKASTIMKRDAAKSMALLEATGDYFEKIVDLVENETKSAKNFSAQLSDIYEKAVGRRPEVTQAEGLILEAYEPDMGVDAARRISELLVGKSYIIAKIKDRSVSGLLYRQPSILVVYLMVSENPAKAKQYWPFVPEEMRSIYTDLGISFDSY